MNKAAIEEGKKPEANLCIYKHAKCFGPWFALIRKLLREAAGDFFFEAKK